MKIDIASAARPTEPMMELVERKGVGHPDTLCDAIAETASRLYSQHCLKRYGGVAHHWFDKVMLVGGESAFGFGRGELTKAYRLIFAGKAARQVGSDAIPMMDIFRDAAAQVLTSCLTGFDPARHMVIDDMVTDFTGSSRSSRRYRPMGSDDLVRLGAKNLVSNDCNLVSGYAPLSSLEALVLFCEDYINGSTFKARNRDTGWDVKIVGSKKGETLDLLINMPFLARDIASQADYDRRQSEVEKDVGAAILSKFGFTPSLRFRASDRSGRAYITSLGSAADTGDVGMVGRGNRLNGLITPMRPMSIEAVCGKNPLDHTGKIYSLLAQNLATELHRSTGLATQVFISTSKENPLDEPDDVCVVVEGGRDASVDRGLIRRIAAEVLAEVHTYPQIFVEGGARLW